MPMLFEKYYRDLNKYNLICSLLVLLLTHNPFASVICFGSFGVVISLFIYRYYQNIEYYFYMNGGLSRKAMIGKVFLINLVISIILFLILWLIL